MAANAYIFKECVKYVKHGRFLRGWIPANGSFTTIFNLMYFILNLRSADLVYIQQKKSMIILPADVLTPKGAKPLYRDNCYPKSSQ